MITRSQKIWWHLAKPLLKIHYRRKYGYKSVKFKIEKDKNYLILMNHAFGADPMMCATSFNKTMAFVITDDINNRGLLSKFINHCACFIPKKKGANDINMVKLMLKAAKEKDSVILCPEGNRTYSGELCTISKSIIKLIKKMKLPVLLYSNEGGYGVDPRWGIKKRKGYFLGHVREEISVDEINKLSDDELYDRVIEGLKVEYNPNNLYKSKHRAEGIERVLYVCPKCGATKSFSSKNEKFWCTKCNGVGEYTTDLKIKSDNFNFDTISKWYNYQIEWVKKYDFNHSNIIFSDTNLELSITENRKKRYISKNVEVIMYSDKFIFKYDNDKEIILNIADIFDMAALMKKKLSFNLKNETYVLKGDNSFNTIKYMYMFYHIKNVSGGVIDEYFGI